MRPEPRSWPQIEGWAAELGMIGSQALDRIVGPPRWARHQEKTAEPPDIDQPGIEPPDADPLDLGWTGHDWPEPEWPDPSWPGFAAGSRSRPVYLSNLAVSDWHKEHHPDRSANLRDADDLAMLVDCPVESWSTAW